MQRLGALLNSVRVCFHPRTEEELLTRRRRFMMGADVAMILAVVVGIAFVASVLTSTGEEDMLPAVPSFSTSGPGKDGNYKQNRYETALEHARKHMQPGYRCPLHPEMFSETPANCPVCGESYVFTAGSEAGYIHKQAQVVVGAQRIKDVIMLGSGWVDRIAVKYAGEQVVKGQLLMEVYSPELKADESQDSGLLRLYSPVAGTVQLIGVQEDKFVGSGATVMQIQDKSSLWLKVSVSKEEASRIASGQRVEAMLLEASEVPVIGEVNDLQVMRDGSRSAWLRFDDHLELMQQKNQVDVRIHTPPMSRAYTPGF